jgi:predicted metalloprotease with PDZ domain
MRIVHRVALADAAAHLVTVETTVFGDDSPLPDPLELFFAVWTPGSYLVREYARHVEGFVCEGHEVTKVRKNRWRVRHGGAREVSVRYHVYCADLTVRTNHVDASHLFLNGAPTFAGVVDHLDVPVEVELDVPETFRVATPLERVSDAPPRFRAPSYDVLVDSPIEAGHFRQIGIEAAGKRHDFAIWPEGAVSDTSVRRLLEATKTIVETEAALFGGDLPHDGYTFLLHLHPRGRGGLEHMTSAALVAPETSFDARDSFLDLASLVAHEYFHLWNVKRMRPAGLAPYRYEDENYTRLLWWFEGATSYYDWRVLRLAKICTATEYLEHLAGELAYLESTPGRLVHPLETASFDAWIKLYRPDESSPNTTVSYYRKGEIVNAMFDLEIRARSEGRSSLDAVLLHLWRTHGARGEPIPEDGMQRLFEEAAGVALGDLFDALVRSAREIDVASALRHAGLEIGRAARGEATASLGIKTRADCGRLYVQSVLRGFAAQRAGMDAGDEIIAVGGKRVDGTGLDAALFGKHGGDPVQILVGRDGRVLALDAVLDGPRLDKIRITQSEGASDAQIALRRAWLGE